MSHKLNQLFKNITEIEPSLDLKQAIFKKIELERKKQTQKDLVLYRVWSLGSLGLAIYSFFVFGSALFESEFWNILTLAFSDVQIVASHWNNYIFSIMETLPIANIIIILMPIFAFVLSLNFYWTLRNKNNFKHYNYV